MGLDGDGGWKVVSVEEILGLNGAKLLGREVRLKWSFMYTGMVYVESSSSSSSI